MIYLVSGRIPYETCFTCGAFLTKERAIDRLHELQSIIPGEFEDTVYYSIDAIELDR